jgi:hypothetical protein
VLLCFGVWYYNRDKKFGAFQRGEILLLIFSRILNTKYQSHEVLHERIMNELVRDADEGKLFSIVNLNI